MDKDGLSDEDKALFRSYVRDISPLDKDNLAKTTKKPRMKEYFLSDYIQEHVFAESILSYANPSLSSKQFNALKNGKIPWEARLDLHGLTIDKARSALSQFIQIHYQKNTGCLLVVHGKGGHHGEPPLMKNSVNRWLPQLDEILAYHSAQAKDGGPGAVYVLLKKNREGESLP